MEDDADRDDVFRRGASCFDEGAYWDAHEAWEDGWRVEPDPARRRLLQGLIQIAAALHKLVVVRSPESALRLFDRGLAKLDAAAGSSELAAFRAGIEACARAVAEGRFDARAVPKLGGAKRA